MSKSLRKDFLREVKKNFSRFVSILLIVVLGVAFYSGIRSAMPAMQMTADKVYDKQSLMDIQVLGTLGMTEDDIKAISNIEGVADIEGSFATDFLCLANSEEIVTKVIAMPKTVNDVKVTEGRFPEKYNECVVSREFLDASGLKVGEYMMLVTGTEGSVFDTLASETFKIVGVCSSSYFLNGDMGTSSIGDGVVDGFAVIPREAFVTDVYTSVYLTVENAKELDCYGSEYQELIDKVIRKIENIADKRCDIRYSEVRSESHDMLQKARNEYYDAKAKAETELFDAEQELLDQAEVLEESIRMFEEQRALLEDADRQIPIIRQPG